MSYESDKLDVDGIFGDEYLNKLYFPEKTERPFIINDFQEIKTISSSRHKVKMFYYKPFNLFIAAKLIAYSSSSRDKAEKEKLRHLMREAKNFRDLEHFENIVTFYGLCVVKDEAWMCMELMDMSLADLYKEFHRLNQARDPSKALDKTKFPEEILGNITVRVLDALSYCKSKNIIHRDIKPHNILLNRKGQTKLCDFDSLATSTVGTIWYWPPERFDKNNIAPYDIRADVWSLGITLLETVCGKLPYELQDDESYNFAAAQLIIVNANIEELVKKIYARQYSSDLKEFTKRCLNKYENRAKFNDLQNTKFCQKYKTELNNEVVKDFISKYFTDQFFYSELQDKDTLNDLTIEWQRKILKTSVTFQGKKICLKKLIDEQNEELKKLIDSETIVKLVSNADVAIGSELVTLGDEENYYINRSFTYPTISMEIFKESQSESQHRNNDLLVINGINKTSLGDLVRKKDTICSFQEYHPDTRGHIRFVILDDSQAAEQFKKLCQLQSNRPTHWLTSDSVRLVWNRSQGSLSNLHKHIEKSNKKYTEDEWLKHTNKLKVIIISDTAGMGKSTVLTNLALKLKDQEQNSDLWIVRINLNEYTNELGKEKEKGDFKAHDINQITNMAIQFLEKDILKLSTPLERALFKTQFKSKTSKLIIMFDGFDEISPDYRETVINLMRGLRNSTIKQIWVTTRPTEKHVLEEQLQHLSFTLESFSEKNQIDFLTKFWQQKLNITDQPQLKQFEIYAEALIRLLARSINDRDKEFTGIPLQTRMLAEAFETDFETFYKSNQTELPEKMGLTDLYERFLKKKYDIQQEKSKVNISQPNVKAQSETGYSKFIEKHQNLALYTLLLEDKVAMLLREKFYQEFSKEYSNVAKEILQDERIKNKLFEDKKQELLSLINDIKISKINNGIIDQIIEDKPHFIHRTFAEYLVGKFLVDSLDNETIVEFVLQEIFMQPAYQVTRAFLNSQLPESLPENTLARYGKQVERLWQSDQKNLYNNKSMTLLHVAAEEGAVKIIRFLLNSLKGHEKILKSLVEARTYYHVMNPTALQLAAAGGYLDVIQCLVEHGADVNVKSIDGETVLHWGAQYYKWDVVQWLVEHGADVNVKSDYGETVLHWAARWNKLDIVQWLVEHGKANVEATDKNGKTVLHYAAQKNKLDVVQWLVEYRKANVEATDNYGRTVLYHAAQENKLDVVQWLVEYRKANVEATDNYGQTVLHYAAQENKLDVVQWLVEHGKANVAATDNYGRTVLHWAARWNKLDIVQWLVEYGEANVEATDKNGKTVLHYAARWNELDVVQWLVEHGKTNVETTDKHGLTVLHHAAQENKLDVIQWLVERGKANVEATDNDGWTVLHWAARSYLDVVQWLVEHGKANIETTDNYGWTVLHYAARLNRLDVVRWLVEHGKANVEATNKHGMTVLHYAAQRDKLDVVQWLVEHGADVNATNIDGKTPLNLAEEQKHTKITEYLKKDSSI